MKMPRGLEKRAAAAVPSALPLLPARPAIVLTVPSVERRRIVWLPVSAI